MNEIYNFFGLPKIDNEILNMTSELSDHIFNSDDICGRYYTNFILNKIFNEMPFTINDVCNFQQVPYGDIQNLLQACKDVFGIIDLSRSTKVENEYSFNLFICNTRANLLINDETTLSVIEPSFRALCENYNGPIIGHVDNSKTDDRIYLKTVSDFNEIYKINLCAIDECLDNINYKDSNDFSLLVFEITKKLKEFEKNNKFTARSDGTVIVYMNNDEIPLKNKCEFMNQTHTKMSACDQDESYILCFNDKSIDLVKDHGRSVINDDSKNYNVIISSIINSHPKNANPWGIHETPKPFELYEVDDDFIKKAQFLLASEQNGLSYIVFAGTNYIMNNGNNKEKNDT